MKPTRKRYWSEETLVAHGTADDVMPIDAAERFESAQALLSELLRHSEQQRPTSEARGAAESLEPRGLAVLPFENVSGTRDDDWLGIAVAELLASQLAQLPGVYVADREQLLKTLSGLDENDDRNAALLEAGRLSRSLSGG